jgi:hypothetical protein
VQGVRLARARSPRGARQGGCGQRRLQRCVGEDVVEHNAAQRLAVLDLDHVHGRQAAGACAEREVRAAVRRVFAPQSSLLSSWPVAFA